MYNFISWFYPLKAVVDEEPMLSSPPPQVKCTENEWNTQGAPDLKTVKQKLFQILVYCKHSVNSVHNVYLGKLIITSFDEYLRSTNCINP